MSNNILPAKDFIELALDVVGKKHKIIIDTGIYKHDYDTNLNHKDDIMIIERTSKQYIELDDLMCIVEYIEYQFEMLEEEQSGRSYFYEGLTKNKKSNTYEITWGS